MHPDPDRNSAFQAIAAALAEWDNFVVTAHMRADGDALSALTAMAQVLERYGKTYTLLLDDLQPDQRYRFLPHFDCIQGWQSGFESIRFEHAIILDAPNNGRLGHVASVLPEVAGRIMIDHHAAQERLAARSYIDEHASSTCELLYRLIAFLAIPFDLPLATCIYTGIAFDTGRFRFANATAGAFNIAAEMMHAGVDPEAVADNIFYKKSASSMRLLGAVLSTLQLYHQAKIVVLRLSYDEFLQQQGNWADLEGFVDYGVDIDGILLALFVKEFQPGEWKFSLRSRCSINVNEIAQSYGGGGHTKAAGFSHAGPIDAFLPEVITRLELELTHQENKSCN